MQTTPQEKFFVTGGTGFLGRHLVAALCRAGYAMKVFTRHPESNYWLKRYPNLEVVKGDLRDKKAVHDAVQGCQYIIHAASLFSFWGDEKDFVDTNVIGTKNVLDAAISADIKRFVYVSTVVIAGNPRPNEIIDENYPPAPVDPYQKTKLAAEYEIVEYMRAHGLPAVIVRPGAFYGPLGDYAFNRLFFKDGMRGLIILLDGGHYITFPVYVPDVALGIIQALQKGRIGEVYNLCGECMTHREVFKIIREEAQVPWPSIIMPGRIVILFSRLLTAISGITRREPFYPINLKSVIFNNWQVSSEKARQELDFQPTGFRQGAKHTVAWYRAGKPMDDWPDLEC